jgi:hypothetical protein
MSDPTPPVDPRLTPPQLVERIVVEARRRAPTHGDQDWDWLLGELAAMVAVAPSAPDAALRAPTGDCLAEEWHRDGRGLWAMRACINKAKHGGRIGGAHVFSAWRYNVHPPSVERPPVAAPPCESSPPQRPGHRSKDWIVRLAANIRDLNPDYHDFEREVERMIRAASVPASPPSTVEIIVNGQPVTVPAGPIREVIAAAIQQAGQIGAPIEQWVLRTTDGEIIPHALPGGVEYALTGGQRFWLHLGLEPVPASPATREGWRCPLHAGEPTGWWSCTCGAEHQMLPPAPAVSPAPQEGK